MTKRFLKSKALFHFSLFTLIMGHGREPSGYKRCLITFKVFFYIVLKLQNTCFCLKKREFHCALMFYCRIFPGEILSGVKKKNKFQKIVTFHALLDIWLSAMFCSHVPFEVTGLYTREDALVTFEGFLSSELRLCFLK